MIKNMAGKFSRWIGTVMVFCLGGGGGGGGFCYLMVALISICHIQYSDNLLTFMYAVKHLCLAGIFILRYWRYQQKSQLYETTKYYF